MQRLSHPNIVGFKVSFFAKQRSQLCIVMTYCDGGDLSERVKSSPGLEENLAKIKFWIGLFKLAWASRYAPE